MSDVRDVLRRAARPPRRPIDIDATAALARERVRHRQLTARAVTVALVVMAVSVGSIVALAGGDHRTVEIAARSEATNADAGLSVNLRDGWQQLPVVDRTAPTEVLVLGTAARPAGDPIAACGRDEKTPTGRAAYLTLYEYRPSDPLAMVADQGQFTAESFQPRPADFRTAQTVGSGDCPTAAAVPIIPGTEATSTTTDSVPTTGSTSPLPDSTVPTTNPVPVLENHFRQIPFSEGQRLFLARIVSVGDPTEEMLGQGFVVLNSLQLTAPQVTTTIPENGPPDKAAATQAIIDAIEAAHGTPSPVPLALSVEGGHPFVSPEAAKAAAEKAATADPITRHAYEASQAGKIVARINWIAFDSATYARLNFDLIVDGQQITVTTTGSAVFEGGNWRMGRGTFCEIVARGGVVHCPS